MRRSLARKLLCLLCFLCLLCLTARPGAQPLAGNLVRFAVIGDSGTGDQHQRQIARQMLAWHDRLPFDLVLMLGDNIYGAFWGGGNRKDFEEKFDRPYAELLARGVVFRAALGNHDTRADEGRQLIQARDRFHIDGPQGYYSFTAGTFTPPPPSLGAPAPGTESAPLVEFFVLNTVRLEKDKKDPEQLAWLEQALAASRARWRIVYGHHPLYSTGRRHGGDPALRAQLEPLFLGRPSPEGSSPVAPLSRAESREATGSGAARLPEAGASGVGREGQGSPRVHVVLAGHDHIYERFHPQKGIVYFVCGSSGQLRRGDARPGPELAAVEDQKHVFLLWEATPHALRFWAINETGQAFDCGLLHPDGTFDPVACPAQEAVRPPRP